MPLSLGKLALAGLLVSGGHTLGHVEQGNQLGIPVNVNYKKLMEQWHTNSIKKDLKIHGAGFRSQDDLARKLGTSPIGKEVSLANAAYKLWYLLGGPKKLNGGIDDIDHIEQRMGSKVPTQASLLVSILSDLHKAKNPNRKWDLGFWQSSNGTPGVIASITR